MHLNLRPLSLFLIQRRLLPCCIYSTQLSNCSARFCVQCSLEDLELKCLDFHNCTVTHNQYHISLIWQVFFPREGDCLLIWSPEGAKIRPRLLNTRQSEAVTVFLIFSPAVSSPSLPTGILYSPQFHWHQDTKMVARRTPRSTSTISRKKILHCVQSIFFKKPCDSCAVFC